MFLWQRTIVLLALGASGALSVPCSPHNPPGQPVPEPPAPERIEVIELPVPPVVQSDQPGSCTPEVNPRLTGCIGVDSHMRSGSFLPDNNHLIVTLNFTGAPTAPDPGHIYSGVQLIIIKTDGSTYSNGDAWRCVTCGMQDENKPEDDDVEWDYGQAFSDGTRALIGGKIFDCHGALLSSESCTPDKMHIYPIWWEGSVNATTFNGAIREPRLHPDSVHFGFSAMSQSGGRLGQNGYFSRLIFNPSAPDGSARYELVNVTRLVDSSSPGRISAKGQNLILHSLEISIGELRGFSGRGNEVTYVGGSSESCNVDAYAADLTTGAVRRLTSHPEYVDPLDISPDDQWTVVLDTRASGRQMFMAGMRGIPPVTDLVTSSVCSSTRNNGKRRFFQPWLIDRYGDRGNYIGQQINAGGDGSPGSVNDPNWNAWADPKWSPDGTKIAYWQQLVVSPACGGHNPLPCPTSTADGGRVQRVMLATLLDRKPLSLEPVPEASDFVPWGQIYHPGEEAPTRPKLAPGEYTLKGNHSGFAHVVLSAAGSSLDVTGVAVDYHDYSDNGISVFNGVENATLNRLSSTLQRVWWFSDLNSTGPVNSSRTTSAEGFTLEIDVLTNIFNANGTLETTVNGTVYKQPANGT